MKYLVTDLLVTSTGGHVFNPTQDAEIFDSYFRALRYVVRELQIDKRLGWSINKYWNGHRFDEGRQEMVRVLVSTGFSFHHLQVTQITENDFVL